MDAWICINSWVVMPFLPLLSSPSFPPCPQRCLNPGAPRPLCLWGRGGTWANPEWMAARPTPASLLLSHGRGSRWGKGYTRGRSCLCLRCCLYAELTWKMIKKEKNKVPFLFLKTPNRKFWKEEVISYLRYVLNEWYKKKILWGISEIWNETWITTTTYSTWK